MCEFDRVGVTSAWSAERRSWIGGRRTRCLAVLTCAIWLIIIVVVSISATSKPASWVARTSRASSCPAAPNPETHK